MSDISYTLDKALQQALAARDFGRDFGGRGVLINTIPGNDTIAQCQSWAKTNSIKLVVLNAKDMDIKMNLDRVIEMADAEDNIVVLFDEYTRAKGPDRAEMFTAMAEAGFSNNLLFCIAVATPSNFGGLPLNDAERSKFTYTVTTIPDDFTVEEALTEAITSEHDIISQLTPLSDTDIMDFMQKLRGGTYFNMGMYSYIPVSRAYKKSFRIYKVINMTAIVSGVSYENIGTTKDFRDRTGEVAGHAWYDHVPGFENKVGAKKKDPNSKYVLWDIKQGSGNWVRYYLVDLDTGVVTPVSKDQVITSGLLTDSEKAKMEPKKVEGIDKVTGDLIQNATTWRTAAFEHIFWLSQSGTEYGTRFVESREAERKRALTESMDPECAGVRDGIIDSYIANGFDDDADLLSGYSLEANRNVMCLVVDPSKDTVFVNPELLRPENLELAAALIRFEFGYILMGMSGGRPPKKREVAKVKARLTSAEQQLISSFTLGGTDFAMHPGEDYSLYENLAEASEVVFRDAHAHVNTDLDAILGGEFMEALTEDRGETFRDAHAGVNTDLDAILGGEVTEAFDLPSMDDADARRFTQVRYDEVAFIDTTGSNAFQKELEAEARKDGFADKLYYESDSMFANVLAASDDIGDAGHVTMYTADDDYTYNCPELLDRLNVTVKVVGPGKTSALTESYRRTVARGKSLADNDLFVDFN